MVLSVEVELLLTMVLCRYQRYRAEKTSIVNQLSPEMGLFWHMLLKFLEKWNGIKYKLVVRLKKIHGLWEFSLQLMFTFILGFIQC
jgi:hypothetical protein